MSPPLFNLHSKDAFGRNGGWSRKQSPPHQPFEGKEESPSRREKGKVMHAMKFKEEQQPLRSREDGRNKGNGMDGGGFSFQNKNRWAEGWSNKRKAVMDLDKEMKDEDIV